VLQQSRVSGAEAEDVELIDSTLVDQDGQPVQFASEAVGDRIVAINFVYTSCTTVCPLAAATFQRLQERLGERLGKEVRLISVSLDPVTDTPARLKDHAGHHKAKPGWIWLTGNKQAVDRVLNGLGTSSANFREHPPLVVVGDGRRGRWSRFYALPGPNQILAQVEALLADRKPVRTSSRVSP
jgi:protein SCO1/2